MDDLWGRALLSAVVGLAVVWLVLVTALLLSARRYPDMALLKQSARLVPDTIRLTRRLAADPSLPRGVRIRLWLLLGYLIVPVDLVPDFLPVIGYADDVVVVALALRSVVRTAGPDALARHWPGTEEGLGVLRRLCRIDGT